MAEPIRPAGETPDDGSIRPAVLTPDDSATEQSEPTTARHVETAPAVEPVTETTDAAPVVERTRTDEPATDAAQVEPVAPTTRAEEPVAEPDVAPAPAQPVLPPAEQAAPQPPRKAGNRLVATAWVLLAAGLFQVVFFGANALVALVFGGGAAVVPQLQSIAATSLAWLPVLLFFLLFELTVLLVNRAGRLAYVLGSLIVGAVVYVATVLLFSVIVRHTLGDANTLAQTFLNWEFILVGLVAREVMLWIGLAIGSRGIRVRRRNREARRHYNEDLADVRG